MNDVSVIDRFLEVFGLYIDSGFGLLGGEVAFLTLTLVTMGEPFFIDPDANPGHLRLNFSHVAPERLSEGLKRLAEVIRQAQAS